MGARRLRTLASLALGVALWSAGARAQDAPPAPTPAPAPTGEAAEAPRGAIALVPPKCPGAGLNVEAFANLLAADLRSDGVDHVSLPGAPAAPSESLLATIALEVEPCTADTRDIDVTIEDQVTRKRVVRRILMKDVAEPLRPRAMALAVAELLRASLLELMTPDAPPPAVRVPPEVKRAVAHRMEELVGGGREAPPPPPARNDVAVTGVWHASVGGHASLYGGRAAVGTLLWPSGLLRIDLGGLAGSAQDSLGDVSLGEAEAGISLLWTSPRDAAVSGAFGARQELGLAWANGHPADQQTSSSYGSGFVYNALLLGEVAFRISPTWRLALEVESGATVVPLVALADARRVTGIQGAMLGIGFGVAQLR